MTTRCVMITDLDQSDHNQPEQAEEQGKGVAVSRTQPKRQRKVLQTISGNFSRRSRSVDCPADARSRQEPTATGKKKQQERTLNGLLQAKEQQLEQLLQRLATLHNYNEQFAKENEQLRLDSGQLERRLAQSQQQLANCERCQQLAQKLAVSIGQNKKLVGDVEMLKTLVFRLNVQIESYQDKEQRRREGNETPVPTASASASSLPDSATLPTHTLAPLLKAYDESIRDKDALIGQYGTEFEHFTCELKRALEENTRLLQAQETLKREVGGWREERTCLQAQLGVCRTKAEAQTRKTDLAKEKLVEVMHCYEQRTQTLLLDMDHLQAAYARTKSELAALKTNAAASPASPDALQQCKTLLEQLKQEHGREQQQLQLRNSELDARCEELRRERSGLQTQLEARGASVEELRRRATSLQRSTEKAKHARDRLKARLRIALQWAQKLEAGNAEMRDTYDAVRRLEVLVKHKEAQLRGLHARNIEELEKLRQKLEQKDDTIKTLLRGKMERRAAVD